MEKKKCPRHKRYSTRSAKVWVCPQCGRITDAEGLYDLFEKLGIDKKLIKGIKDAIEKINKKIKVNSGLFENHA